MKVHALLCLLFCQTLFSLAQTAIPKLQPVDAGSILLEKAISLPHVTFVNVGKAVNEVDFREAVAAVSLVENINLVALKTNALPSLNTMMTRSFKDSSLHTNSCLVVYIVKDKELASFISNAFAWSVLNVQDLEQDTPSPEKFKRRLRQTMLRGLAFACGVGATFDSTRCVMGASTFSLEGMDKASSSFSPYAAGPVQDALLRIGGDKIFAPPPTE
jgi:hypothetical protein